VEDIIEVEQRASGAHAEEAQMERETEWEAVSEEDREGEREGEGEGGGDGRVEKLRLEGKRREPLTGRALEETPWCVVRMSAVHAAAATPPSGYERCSADPPGAGPTSPAASSIPVVRSATATATVDVAANINYSSNNAAAAAAASAAAAATAAAVEARLALEQYPLLALLRHSAAFVLHRHTRCSERRAFVSSAKCLTGTGGVEGKGEDEAAGGRSLDGRRQSSATRPIIGASDDLPLDARCQLSTPQPVGFGTGSLVGRRSIARRSNHRARILLPLVYWLALEMFWQVRPEIRTPYPQTLDPQL
jgi:hypothetical protein